MERLAAVLPEWAVISLSALAAILVALVLHHVLYRLFCSRFGDSKRSFAGSALVRLRSPSRWALVAIALALLQPALPLDARASAMWARIAGLIFVALIGWLALCALGIAGDVLTRRADISAADNLQARRRRTRIYIFQRIFTFVIVFATAAMMLMSIPSIRTVGVTLIASAGLAALAIGAAAQPALKNLIAGLQMAFTEPIRIDDVVIIDGEWGRIEEIRLTYVVVKVWDERRLIVPISKILEQTFQNWTRSTSKITGSVYWHFDPATDVEPLRDEVRRLVTTNENWDGRFCNLQVTDSGPQAIEVRALMTARDASAAFDLRCDVREGLLRFVRTRMPEAIVRYRGEMQTTK